MKLKVLDQILVSAVQPDVLMPGQEFTVSEAVGRELMTRNPRSFEMIDKPAGAKAEGAAPQNKAQGAAPRNKAEAAPSNKAGPKPQPKSE